jgi:hypothetical protein
MGRSRAALYRCIVALANRIDMIDVECLLLSLGLGQRVQAAADYGCAKRLSNSKVPAQQGHNAANDNERERPGLIAHEWFLHALFIGSLALVRSAQPESSASRPSSPILRRS